MINIKIDEKLSNKVNVHIASIEAKVKTKESDKELLELINKKCKEIKETIKFDEVIKLKNILSSRNAYKKIGKDPSRYRLSSESLVKRVVKGNDLYYVNNIVDINNLISLETCYSVGTYDLDKVKGSITFTLGEENERYEGIGRGSINLENLPVFEDEDGKFGSTTSDSVKAMITNDTTHILMNIIAFEEDENLERYIEYSKELLERFADATVIDTKITIGK